MQGIFCFNCLDYLITFINQNNAFLQPQMTDIDKEHLLGDLFFFWFKYQTNIQPMFKIMWLSVAVTGNKPLFTKDIPARR